MANSTSIPGHGFVTLITESTMVAAVEIIHQRGLNVDLDALVLALREECKVTINRIMDQGDEVLSRAGSAWFKSFVQAEVAEAARSAVESVA